MGTAAYMSPEQARGKKVDKRCDVWAFGAVLYEMLTGRQVFEGGDASEILAGVIKSEPSWERLPGDTPQTLKLYLQRCLEKDPRERVRDIGDVRLALHGAFELGMQAPVPSRSVLPWIAAGVALAIVIGSMWSRDAGSPNQAPARFAIPVEGELPSRTGRLLAISSDGRELIYVAVTEDGDQLYHRPMNRLEAVPVPDTEGASHPFFSPNGQWVGFSSADGDLKKVSISGGPPTLLCRCNPTAAVWGKDGTIVFTDDNTGQLMRVSSDGGTPESITTLAEGELIHDESTFLPNGEEMIFAVRSGSLSTARLEVLSLATGERRLLGEGFFPRYTPTGHLIYGHSGGSLMAVRFDTDRLEMIGDPVRVLDGVRIEAGGSVQFDFADNGSAFYIAGGVFSRVERELVWVDREGREEPLGAAPLAYKAVQLSPDGARIALEVLGSALEDIWLYDVARETASQLTFDTNAELTPLWMPDGQHVIFLSLRGSQNALFSKRADGVGQPERLMASKKHTDTLVDRSWGRDTGLPRVEPRDRLRPRECFVGRRAFAKNTARDRISRVPPTNCARRSMVGLHLR